MNIKLNCQSLSAIPDDLQIDKCRKLDLSDNKFTDVNFPKGLIVSMLNLSKNSLSSVDARELKELTVLNLSWNQIQEFPSLPLNLKALILNNNTISKVQDISLPNGTNTLVLSKNQISQFENFTALGLKKLSLGHNALTSLDINTPDLRELKVNNNQISTLTSAQASGFPKVEILDLGNNRIEEFRNLIHLISLKNLRQLNLKGNPITGLKDYHLKIRKMFPRLKVLDGENLRSAPKTQSPSPEAVETVPEIAIESTIETTKVNNTETKKNKVEGDFKQKERKKRKILELSSEPQKVKSGVVSISIDHVQEEVDGKMDILKVLEGEKELLGVKW